MIEIVTLFAGLVSGPQAYHKFAGLGAETTVRFISPLAAPVSRSASQRHLFAGSAGVANVGLFWLVEKVPPMGFARRVADAVAIAGREAGGSGRRGPSIATLAPTRRHTNWSPSPATRGATRSTAPSVGSICTTRPRQRR